MKTARELRLRRLRIEGFGRLERLAFEPVGRPGSVVVAPNEAGKSTLAAALFRGLFGFADKAREEARRPWSGGPYRVSQQWLLGSDEVCTIERDFDTQEVTVEWRTSGALDVRWAGRPNPRGSSADREAYDGHLRRLLGFTSPDIFRQTAFIGPGEAAVRPLAGELLRLLSGSERADFRAVLAAFEDGYYALTQADLSDPQRIAKHKPRRLEEIAATRSALLQRREAALAAEAARKDVEGRLAASRARLGVLETELESGRAVREAVTVLKQTRAEIDALEVRRGQLDEAARRFEEWERTVVERTRALEPVVRYLRHPGDFSERLQDLERLGEARSRAAEELGRIDARLAAGRQTGWPALAAAGGAALALGGAALALGGAAILVAWSAAGLGLLAAIWGGWQWRARRAHHRQRLVRKAELDRDLARLDDERRTGAAPLHVDVERFDPAAERVRYARAAQLRAELDGMQAARPALGDREAIERERAAIKEQRLDVLRLERRQLLEQHPYLKEGPDYERRFLQEQTRLAAERERVLEEELRCRRALADRPGPVDDPRRIDREVARLDAEAERLMLERDAYRLAHVTLTDCKDGFLRRMTRRLEHRIGQVLEELTDRRYTGVEIDPVTLDLRVHGVEKRSVPAEQLSRGTADQLYFALRVALLGELATDRALPLVLDEPFLHFDQERLARAERMLLRVGERHQVLLLTHDPRLAEGALPRSPLLEIEAGQRVSAG